MTRLIMCAFLCSFPSFAQETVAFEENFESNEVNSKPLGWLFNAAWGDVGAIRITNDPVSQGARAVKVKGLASWAQGIYKPGTVFSGNQTIVFDALIPSGNLETRSPGYFMYAGFRVAFHIGPYLSMQARLNHMETFMLEGLELDRWYTYTLEIHWDMGLVRLSQGERHTGWMPFTPNAGGGFASDISLYGNNNAGQNNTIFIDQIIQFPSLMMTWDGLHAYYPFDGNAMDVTGNGHQGELLGGVAFQEGVFSQAAFLDGLDDYVLFDNLPSLSELTVSFWVRFFSYEKQILYTASCGPDLRGGVSFSLNNRAYGKPLGFNTIKFVSGKDCTRGASHGMLYPQYKDLGEWRHVAGVFSGGAKMEIYYDGELASSKERDIPEYFISNLQYFGTDSRQPGEKGNFHGWVDDLRIYSRALGQEEVRQLYKGAVPPALLGI